MRKKKGDDSSNGGELVGEGETKRRWDGGNNKICSGFSDEKIHDGWVSLTRCKKDKKKGQRVEPLERTATALSGEVGEKERERQQQGRGTCWRG